MTIRSPQPPRVRAAALAAMVLPAVLAAATVGCDVVPIADPSVPDEASLGTTSLPFDSAVSLFRLASGVERSDRVVIHDDREWAAQWEIVARGRLPRIDRPLVDFTRQMVLFASMGARATSGYTIAISSIDTTGGALRATVTQTAPGARCATTPFVTRPIAAVVVPRRSGDVTWIERTAVADCAP